MTNGDRFSRLNAQAAAAFTAEDAAEQMRAEAERWRQQQAKEEAMMLHVRRFGVLDYFDAGHYEVKRNPLVDLLPSSTPVSVLAVACAEVHLVFYSTTLANLMVLALCCNCDAPITRPSGWGGQPGAPLGIVYPHAELNTGEQADATYVHALSAYKAMSKEELALARHWYLTKLGRFMAMVDAEYHWLCYPCNVAAS